MNRREFFVALSLTPLASFPVSAQQSQKPRRVAVGLTLSQPFFMRADGVIE